MGLGNWLGEPNQTELSQTGLSCDVHLKLHTQNTKIPTALLPESKPQNVLKQHVSIS